MNLTRLLDLLRVINITVILVTAGLLIVILLKTIYLNTAMISKLEVLIDDY